MTAPVETVEAFFANVFRKYNLDIFQPGKKWDFFISNYVTEISDHAKKEAIVSSLESIHYQIGTLVVIVAQQPYKVLPTLRLLSEGLKSKGLDVCTWTCNILVKLHSVLMEAEIPPSNFIESYQWFTKDGGIDLVLTALNTHSMLKNNLMAVIEGFAQRDLAYLVCTVLHDKLKEREKYYTLVDDLMVYMSQRDSPASEIVKVSKLPEKLISLVIASTDKKDQSNCKLAANSLLTNLYVNYSLESQMEVVASVLKKGCHDRSSYVRIQSFAALFTVLEHAASAKHTVSNEMHKFLVFQIVEQHGEDLKLFYQRLLTQYVSECDYFPINSLSDTFLRVLLVQSYENIDLEMLAVIANHKSLGLPQVKKLLMFLWTVSTTDLALGRCAHIPLTLLLNSRYAELMSDIEELVKKGFVSLTLGPSSFEKEARTMLFSELLTTLYMLRHQTLSTTIKELSFNARKSIAESTTLQAFMAILVKESM